MSQASKPSDQTSTENFLLEVFGSSRAVIYSCNLSSPFRFDFISSNLEQIFGYTVEEWKASDDIWKEIIHPSSLGRIANEMTRFQETQLIKLQYQLRHKTGHYLWVEDHMRLIKKDGEELRLIGTVFDVTDIKSQEIQVLENSKMIALGQMASGIAHEINNPLAIISGKVRLLSKKVSKGTADPSEIQIILDHVDQTCFRIARIIQGLRNFSRDASSDPFDLVNIQRVIFDTAELSRARFEQQNIELIIDAKHDLIFNGRGTQFSQVILSLLNNAYDAIVDSNVTEKWVKIRCREISGLIQISVTDSGPGVPADLRDKIMQPFFSTKPTDKGTGLGLSTSKGIIEDHGGQLALSSTSANTEFVIVLPLAKPLKAIG